MGEARSDCTTVLDIQVIQTGSMESEEKTSILVEGMIEMGRNREIETDLEAKKVRIRVRDKAC